MGSVGTRRGGWGGWNRETRSINTVYSYPSVTRLSCWSHVWALQ
jgi:hypothetical protein